jgi:GAG-pre-integrase domain/Integrase core domain
MYYLYLSHFEFGEIYLSVIASDSWLWHRRLGHVSMDSIKKLVSLELVRVLPTKRYELEGLCDACMQGKHKRSSFKVKKMVSTNSPLELLHLDLFGPITIPSISRKKFVLVIVDYYSHFTWVIFLISKDETFEQFVNFYYRVENKKSSKIGTIRSDHGEEFKNIKFDDFYNKSEYRHEYSAPHTPQQNGVVKRKNRTLQELIRTMLHEYTIPKFLWAEAVNTTCHVVNRVSLRPHY